MNLKDLFKYLESENKFNEFMSRNGYKEVKYIEIQDLTFRGEEFKSAKQLVKAVNENYYANIDENIELINENGYIELYFEQQIPDYKLVDGKVVKEIVKEMQVLYLYIETKQVWE